MSEVSTLGAGSVPLPPVGADDSSPAPASAGGLLRAARERQGLHLAVLAASLKVAPRKLEQIEGDRYDELVDATFVRALALSMCRALKIDAEPVLSRLPQPALHGRGLDHVSRGLNQPYRDRDGRGDGGEWRRFLSLPLIAAALLVIAALAVYWLPAGSWSPAALLPRTDGAAASPASSAAVAREEAAAEQSMPAPVAEPAAAPAAASTSTEPGAPVVESLPSAPAGAMPTPASGGLLSLRAAAESWVEVRDASGQILLSRMLAAGEAVGLNGVLPLRLVIGNAESTQVTFRGQPVRLNPGRDNVARLDLK